MLSAKSQNQQTIEGLREILQKKITEEKTDVSEDLDTRSEQLAEIWKISVNYIGK